jgi:hypothetical protein
MRLGFEFWDALFVGAGMALAEPKDRAQFSQEVARCAEPGPPASGCDEPSAEKSSITMPFFSVEAGAQHRFRLFPSSSFLPGLALGRTFGAGMSREINCAGCRSDALGGSATGSYLAPFFRITFADYGLFAATVRSAWFVAGDLQQLTTLSFEIGQP